MEKKRPKRRPIVIKWTKVRLSHVVQELYFEDSEQENVGTWKKVDWWVGKGRQSTLLLYAFGR